VPPPPLRDPLGSPPSAPAGPDTPRPCSEVRRIPRVIEDTGRGVRIGAAVRATDAAYDPLVLSRYPALAQALLAGTSAQHRDSTTLGESLAQRTRCPYFRETNAPCNKRDPGSGCSAWDGHNRTSAVLGGSEHCIATHPSDACVALVALDAVVIARGPAGLRAIPMRDFHTLPGARPELETVLGQREVATHVELPDAPFAARSRYVRVQDRAPFEACLASAAVALEIGGGRVRSARVVLGGVATKPWRCLEAEDILVGQRSSLALYEDAAAAALRDAVPRRYNAFKVPLARRVVVRALMAAGAPE
jgi:xanthine dehydrogenase YagS FAD-binding subunit